MGVKGRGHNISQCHQGMASSRAELLAVEIYAGGQSSFGQCQCHRETTRFHHHLYGRDNITAETDPKPLIETLSEAILNTPKYLQSLLLAGVGY